MDHMQKVTAYHEAAHSVVNYRCAGFVGGATSIIPRADDGILGASHDGCSDSFNAEHMEARVLSCYAGGHAQRELDPTTGADGCAIDDEIAADLLRRYGWETRETELRDRALILTRPVLVRNICCR